MKKFLSILAATVLILSTCSISFADPAVSENIFTPPTNEEVESLSLYTQMLESEDPTAFVATLTPQDVLLLNIQVGKAVDLGQADQDTYMLTLGRLWLDVSPNFTENDYNTYLISSYPTSFKYVLIDVARQSDTNIDTTLMEIANSEQLPPYLRVSATTSISYSPDEKIELLSNLYEELDDSTNKNVLLKNLSLEDMELAAEKADVVVNSYGDVDLKQFALADRIMIRSLTSFDSKEATEILTTNEKILKATDDPLVIEVCLQALAEFKDERAAEVVLQNVDLNNQYGAFFFVNQNFDSVATYLDGEDFSQTVKCVEATPIDEFKPYLQAKLRTKSVDVPEEEIQRLIEIIDMSDNNNVSTVASARGRQGLAAFRDGVIMNVTWHAAIVNSISIDPNNQTDVTAFIQATGPNYAVDSVPYKKFMGDAVLRNKFQGYYNRGAGTRTRMEILDLARELTHEGIQYSDIYLLEHGSEGPDSMKITIPEITGMRCDGVVEFCYEEVGVRIQGSASNWDITTIGGCAWHHLGNLLTPKTQASIMNLVDANI